MPWRLLCGLFVLAIFGDGLYNIFIGGAKMDSKTFDQIVCKIMELTGKDYVFRDLRLISYDENTHHAVIQVPDILMKNYIKRNFTNEIIEAFDKVLGVEATVSCIRVEPKRRKPHERFMM